MTTKYPFKPVDEQLAYLRKGAAEIIREEDLRAKLEASLKAGGPLRVKLGVENRKRIQTVRGTGYMYVSPEKTAGGSPGLVSQWVI